MGDMAQDDDANDDATGTQTRLDDFIGGDSVDADEYSETKEAVEDGVSDVSDEDETDGWEEHKGQHDPNCDVCDGKGFRFVPTQRQPEGRKIHCFAGHNPENRASGVEVEK